MDVITILKIHGKDIICKIKRLKSKRNLSYILSYGHLRITCGTSYSQKKIIELIESSISPNKVNKIFSEDLINEQFVYLLGEKRKIIVLNEGQNSNSMTDLIVRNRRDIDKYIDKFRNEVFTNRVRQYEQMMHCNIVHEVKSRSFDRAYGKNFYGSKNQIVLEKRLIHFSLEIIDHTILHELCHDFYHDHSKNFYNLLGIYCPNYKKLKDKLNYGVRK